MQIMVKECDQQPHPQNSEEGGGSRNLNAADAPAQQFLLGKQYQPNAFSGKDDRLLGLQKLDTNSNSKSQRRLSNISRISNQGSLIAQIDIENYDNIEKSLISSNDQVIAPPGLLELLTQYESFAFLQSYVSTHTPRPLPRWPVLVSLRLGIFPALPLQCTHVFSAALREAPHSALSSPSMTAQIWESMINEMRFQRSKGGQPELSVAGYQTHLQELVFGCEVNFA